MSAAANTLSGSVPKTARKPVSGWAQLMRLLPYVTRHKGEIVIGFITQAGMGITGTLLPLILGVITDCLKGAEVPLAQLGHLTQIALGPLLPYYHPKDPHTLAVFCTALVIICAVEGVFSYWTRQILIGLSRDIEYDLRNDLLGKLVLMEPEFYVRNRTGELMSRCTHDLNAVRMVLGPGIMYSATTISTMVLAIFFMLKLSPALTAWVLIPVPIVAIVTRYFGQIIHRLSEQIQAALGVLSTRAQENLTGVRVIRAYAQEKQEVAKFDEANRDYVNRNIKLISTWSLFFPGLSTLIGMTVLILLWLGGKQVIDHRVSLGTFNAFYMFLIQLVWPMIALGWVTNIFQRGAASMGRLNYIMNAEPGIRDASAPTHTPSDRYNMRPDGDAPPAQEKSKIQGEIEFRDLTFTYPTAGSETQPGEPVLREIDLDVPAGSTLAIVGPTGSGKSTLAALIARLWEAPPGTLFIDERSIREYPLTELRSAIGYVPQDTFLFSETISENISFGVTDAVEEQVFEAAEIASISGEIESFPQRFGTMVGERGITLSGGQKQRTSLA